MRLNIIEALVKIANALDAKGLFDEAGEIDNIVKSAIFGLGKGKRKSEKELLGLMLDLGKVTKDKDKIQIALVAIKNIHEETLKLYTKYMETEERQDFVNMNGGAWIALGEFKKLWEQNDLANIAKGSVYESEIKNTQQTILVLFKDCHDMQKKASQKYQDIEMAPERKARELREQEAKKKSDEKFRRDMLAAELSNEAKKYMVPAQDSLSRQINEQIKRLVKLHRQRRITDSEFYEWIRAAKKGERLNAVPAYPLSDEEWERDEADRIRGHL